jgi:RNA polymerase-binding transcription factor DksA
MELRAHMLNRQNGLSKDALEQQPGFSSHMADAGTDTFDRDFALGMLSSEQDALYEIDEALNRIRDGTYSKCELTGKRIEAARLEAIPWTRFSAAAEKQLEREGALRKVRLGPRETVAKTEASGADEEGD